MRQFVPLLAFFLDGFASDDALAVPAQGSQRNLLKNETALVTPVHIDGNGALQAVDKVFDDDEERLPNLKMLAPLFEYGEKVKQGLKTKVDTPAVEMGPYWMRFARRTLQLFAKWRTRLKLMSAYKAQQEVLASTPVVAHYDQLMLRGHSPIKVKEVSVARGTEELTNLPPSVRMSEEVQLHQLVRFITHSHRRSAMVREMRKQLHRLGRA